jgi:hypothetical protein
MSMELTRKEKAIILIERMLGGVSMNLTYLLKRINMPELEELGGKIAELYSAKKQDATTAESYNERKLSAENPHGVQECSQPTKPSSTTGTAPDSSPTG